MPLTIDARLLEVLHAASTLQLYELHVVLDRMLSDPARIVHIHKSLHLGQTVRFLSPRDARMHEGTIVELRDKQLTVQEHPTRHALVLPYAAIEPPLPNSAANPTPQAAPAPQPPRATRDNFRIGEKVSFEDKHLNTVVGIVVRINQRTASIDPGDGTTWRVGFSLLRHVIDIRAFNGSSSGS